MDSRVYLGGCFLGSFFTKLFASKAELIVLLCGVLTHKKEKKKR